MKQQSYSTLALVFALAIAPAIARAQNAREVAKKVSPSVVLLVMEDNNGQPLAMGSGFVVKDGIVATNLHVIEGASRGYAKLADRKEKFNIAGTVAVDAARDIVLLTVEDIKAPPLPIGDSKQLAVGEEVYAVGNPRGLEGTFSAGIISSIRKVGDDSLLQITAPISPGSSGGPVMNSKGDVIGVAVATFKGGQNLNFAIPSAYLSALTGQIKATVPLAKAGERPKDSKAKSILEDLGGSSTDGVSAETTTWDSPTQSGEFSFSLHNKLRDAVSNVYCLVVFYDTKDAPIDFSVVRYANIIPPGLAKRVKGKVDDITEQLNSPPRGGFHGADPSWQPPRTPRSKIEFRILGFDLVTDDGPNEKRGDATPVPVPDDRVAPARPAPNDAASTARIEGVEAAFREPEKKRADSERKLAEAVAKLAPAGDGPDLIETTTDGDFSGWEGETIFKLANGQIWQQVTYAYTYHYAFRPKVMIIKTNGAYKMKVDDVAGTIFVKRIK